MWCDGAPCCRRRAPVFGNDDADDEDDDDSSSNGGMRMSGPNSKGGKGGMMSGSKSKCGMMSGSKSKGKGGMVYGSRVG